MRVWTSESRLQYDDVNRIETDIQTISTKMRGYNFYVPNLKFITNRQDEGAYDTPTQTRLSFADTAMVDGGYNNIEHNLSALAFQVSLPYTSKDFTNQSISFVDVNRWEWTIVDISRRVCAPWMVYGVGVLGDGHYFGGGIFG